MVTLWLSLMIFLNDPYTEAEAYSILMFSLQSTKPMGDREKQ